MSIRVRESPSGKAVRGTPGVSVLGCVNTADEWDAVSSAAFGGLPLSNTFYVDIGTSVDPGDQDGSIGKPFSTIAAGAAAFTAAGALGALYITNGDYTDEGPLTINAQNGVLGLYSMGGDIVLVDDLILELGESGYAFLEGIHGTGIVLDLDESESSTELHVTDGTFPDGISFTGDGAPQLYLFSHDNLDSVGIVDVQEVRYAFGYSFTGTLTCTGEAQIENCSCEAQVSAGDLNALNCSFAGAISNGSTTRLEGCSVGNVNVATGTAFTAFSTSLQAAQLTADGAIQLDQFTFAFMMQTGTVLNGTSTSAEIVDGLPQTITMLADANATINPMSFPRFVVAELGLTANRTLTIDDATAVEDHSFWVEVWNTNGGFTLDVGGLWTSDGTLRQRALFRATADTGPYELVRFEFIE